MGKRPQRIAAPLGELGTELRNAYQHIRARLDMFRRLLRKHIGERLNGNIGILLRDAVRNCVCKFKHDTAVSAIFLRRRHTG